MAAFVVGGAFLLYLVGLNLFLGTRLFRNAIGFDPDSLLVEYANAYSLVPGRIHVEGLRIRGRDSNVEWLLAIDRCDFHTTFWEILRQKFHASDVKAEGLSLRLRRRRDTFTKAEMAATPPVPGFLDPPLSDPGPPTAPLTDATYNLWAVQLDGIDVKRVREIWIDTLRYAGDLEIRGSWLFRPVRWLEIGPAVVDLHPVEVSFGTIEPWVSDAAGSLKVTVHPTDLRATRGADILHRISIEGAFRGKVRAANAANRASLGARVVHADAPVDVHLQVDHGVLRRGTQATVAPFDVLALADGLSFDASITADLGIDLQEQGSAVVRCSTLRVAQGRYARASVRTVVASMASRELDLVHPFSDTTFALDLTSAEADSLQFLRTLVPIAARVSFDSSGATASGHLEGTLADRTARGRLEAVVGDVAVAFGDSRLVAAKLSAQVHVDLDAVHEVGSGTVQLTMQGLRARMRTDILHGDLHATLRASQKGPEIDLSGSSLAFVGDPADRPTPWWGRADVRDGRLSTQGEPRFRGTLRVVAKDASPLTTLLETITPIPNFVVDAVSTKGFEATGELLATSSSFQARSVKARGAGVDAEFDYYARGDDKEWDLALNLGLLQAGVHRASGRTEFVLFDVKPWFDEKVTALRATEREAE